jgi:predicted ATPase
VPLSREVRLLESRWGSNQGWPKRLEWVEIDGLRGWIGQRIEFKFPITAIVGENGVGKSSILQAVAASFNSKYYPSEFFPDTPWETVTKATIKTCHRDGPTSSSITTSLRKLTERWRGHEERKDRPVVYIDLARIQPIGARVGYARMAKRDVKETRADAFDAATIERLSRIMGREYATAKLSTTDAANAARYRVPVVARGSESYSGFHSGAGETVLAELLDKKIQKFSIVLIDEIETSLHPRTQRRLVRDLAILCRSLEIQCILTTHSPYVLDELPPDARICLDETQGQKRVISGISPAFAMSKMDEDRYPEADVWVEDERSVTLLNEIVSRTNHADLIVRYQALPFGAANVGRMLGTMCKEGRFKKPSVVFLDGDQDASDGCAVLPGGDAPERVVFEGLLQHGLNDVATRISRSAADVADTCRAAALLQNHHDWIKTAADRLHVSGDILWQAMCAEWSDKCLPRHEAERVGDHIVAAMVQSGASIHSVMPPVLRQPELLEQP